MDPKTIIETGKAAVEFLQAVVEFVGNSKLKKGEVQRLLAFYIALQEYLEVKADYFSLLETLECARTPTDELLWQSQKLSLLMTKKHFEAYRAADGLAFHVRPYNHSLYELFRDYRGAVSKSLGFGPEEVKVAAAYHSLGPTHLKRKHFESTYRISFQGNEIRVGTLVMGDKPEYRRFVSLHTESHEAMVRFLAALEGVIRDANKHSVKMSDDANRT